MQDSLLWKSKERNMPFKEPAEKTPSPSQKLTTTTKLLQQPAVITGCSKLDFLLYFSSFSVSASLPQMPHGVRINSGLSLACFWALPLHHHFNSIYGDGGTLGSPIISPALIILINISFLQLFLSVFCSSSCSDLCQTLLLHELALQIWKWEVWWSFWAAHLCLFSSQLECLNHMNRLMLHGCLEDSGRGCESTMDRKSETILREGLAVFLLQIWGKTVVWRKKPPGLVGLGAWQWMRHRHTTNPFFTFLKHVTHYNIGLNCHDETTSHDGRASWPPPVYATANCALLFKSIQFHLYRTFYNQNCL